MDSKFAVARHPIHPALVAVPIGLFVWALVCDIVYVARDHEALWYDMAYWAGIGAVITALVAALPGFGDYFTVAIKTPARGIATAHMVLNLTVVVLFALGIFLMYDDGAASGGELATVIVLHALGVGLLGLSGWLGGELVFRHRIAVPDGLDPTGATETRPRYRAARLRG